jgi:hypothetical protein
MRGLKVVALAAGGIVLLALAGVQVARGGASEGEARVVKTAKRFVYTPGVRAEGRAGRVRVDDDTWSRLPDPDPIFARTSCPTM